MMRTILLAVVVLALTCGAASAAGINIEGADVGPAYWTSITTGEAITIPLQITLHPYPQTGPDVPTSLADLDDWAKANLGIDIPFEGDPDTFLKPLGVGVSECVKVGTLVKVPLRAGAGWHTILKWSVFVKSDIKIF